MCRGTKVYGLLALHKVLLSKKGLGGGIPVVLSEGGKVVTDQPEVFTIFNNFFVNVAKDIGNGGHSMIRIFRPP